MGRFASLLFLGSGFLVIATVPLAPPEVDRSPTIIVGALALVVGFAAWLAPWHRWPRAASLVLVPLAFALIAAGNVFETSTLHTYGIFFVVAFVWIGVAHPPGTSLWLAPLAFVAFMVPLSYLPGEVADGVAAAALTILVAVLVGESLARGARHLARTEEALTHQRKVAERLQELDEMKQHVMSTISHELRTPITISRGHLEVLGARPEPEEIRQAVGIVVDELERMGRIVDDLKTLVRMEDPQSLTREPVRLSRFVADLAAKAKPLLGDRLRIVSEADGAVVRIDRQRLTQAMLNLLHNAAVHGAPDGPVELRASEEAGGWRLEVADRGGGLPGDQEESLFLPFRTGPSPSPGSGLGLSIVRAVAEAHGGSAGVENEPGRGARFWVRVPT